MSDLESSARAIIRPFINDLSVQLDPQEQHLVAAWGVKTAMVFECTNPTKQWFYSDAERQRLRTSRTLPLMTSVWIGRYARGGFSFGEAKRLLRAEPEDSNPLSEGYVTTFALAHFVIQVLTIRLKPEHKPVRIVLKQKRGPWNRLLLPVFPSIRPVTWPPQLTFTDEDALSSLGGRFTNPP